MATISKFVSRIQGKELARQARFDVSFKTPRIMGAPFRTYKDELTFRCDTAQLPSRVIMTTDQKIYGYVEKFPYGTSFDDASFIFIVSDDMQEKKLFDQWLKYVNPTNTYNVNFKEDYETDIQITQYSLTGKETYRTTLRKAYPIAMGDLDLTWASEGYHTLQVSFSFSTWDND
jgi:hypothetical protein